MRVGELAAGGGYTTELVVRAVGEGGIVFAENPPAFGRPRLAETEEYRPFPGGRPRARVYYGQSHP
jgi:predicted methyltransferase